MITSAALKYPSAILKRYIYYYTYTEADYKDDSMHFQVFPTPNIRLYFNFEDQGKGKSVNGNDVEVPLHGLLGIQTQKNYELTLPSNSIFKHLVIFFKPSGFSQLFQSPGSVITNLCSPIDDIVRNELYSLACQLAENEDFSYRINVIENYFINRLAKCYSAINNIEYAVEKIMNTTKEISIKQLSSECNLSVRQFERKFKEIVGVSAMNLICIKRFDSCLIIKEKFPLKKWCKIAHEVGYADQMHMIREFKRFTNSSPSAGFSYDQQVEGINWHMLRDLVNA